MFKTDVARVPKKKFGPQITFTDSSVDRAQDPLVKAKKRMSLVQVSVVGATSFF